MLQSDSNIPVASLVTLEVARALDQGGNFILPRPAPQPYPILSEDQAKALAVTWARQFAPFIRQFLERGHGAPIELAKLDACPRPFFADTPYEPVVESDPNYVRNLFGPSWLLSLCGPDGVPRVSLAVAAYATDVRLESGRIVFPMPHGNIFLAFGVPRGSNVPITPERAVAIITSLTGRRAAAVPELVLAGRPFAPQLARWRVTLDAAVEVRALESGQRVTVQDLYVGEAGDGTPEVVYALDRSVGATEGIWNYPAPGGSSRGDTHYVPVRVPVLISRAGAFQVVAPSSVR